MSIRTLNREIPSPQSLLEIAIRKTNTDIRHGMLNTESLNQEEIASIGADELTKLKQEGWHFLADIFNPGCFLFLIEKEHIGRFLSEQAFQLILTAKAKYIEALGGEENVRYYELKRQTDEIPAFRDILVFVKEIPAEKLIVPSLRSNT